MDLDSVAKDLYGLAPSEFTAARDAQVAKARGAGDRALADSVRRLRKPSVAAWLANLLARERRSDVEALVKLGDQLRAAQDRLDGDKIRHLSNERHEKVAVLLREAQALAQKAHQSVSSSAMEDLEGTLDAALADRDAAEALSVGRLSKALHYSGLGLADIGPDKTASGGGRRIPTSTSKDRSLETARTVADRAQREFERARAAAQVAHDAVVTADAKLKLLKTKAELADRRVKDAAKKARQAKGRAELARRPKLT